MLKRILGYLMFLANSEGNKYPWYELKDILCKRFGVNNGYDIQYLEGKKCNRCNGTGLFIKSSFGRLYKERCYCCYNGMYTPHRYVVLERIKVGDHLFHRPIKNSTDRDVLSEFNIPNTVVISGYIHHKKQKYGWIAFSLLFLLFMPKRYWQYVKTMGSGWRCYWWLPRNYLYNFMHLIKKREKSIPVSDFKRRIRRRKAQSLYTIPDTADDLPF